MQLLEDFAAVSQVTSVGALRDVAERLIQHLEFERYELQLVVGASTAEQWFTVENVPEGYLPLFNQSGSVCPVMQHAKNNSSPLFWDQSTYERAGQMEKYEVQAPWGYGTGFIVAAHLPRDKHVVVSVEREKPLRHESARLTHKLATFQLFATCAIDACVTALGGQEAFDEECPLSKRELEVLRWTLAGKTAWEVGAILGISQGTAAQCVNGAARKLGAINKHQAALMALRYGWIV